MPAQHPERPANRTPFHLILILGAGILAYSNSLRGPFLFDDPTTIVSNPLIRDLGRFFTDPALFMAFPRRFIGFLTLALNYRLGGLNVAGYHAVNLLLHLATSLLLYAFCRVLLSRANPEKPKSAPDRPHFAFLAAILFAIHPIQTQAVSYITQRFTILATLFYLLALLCYCRARLSGRYGRTFPHTAAWYAAALLATICAMLSKEISFTLPLAVVLCDLTFFRDRLRNRLNWLVPFIGTLAILPILTLLTGASEPELSSLVGTGHPSALLPSHHDYLITQLAAIATYLRLLLLPVNQTLDYDYPLYSSLSAVPLLGAVLLLALIVLAAALLRRSSDSITERLAGFGILWFILSLTVESGLVPLADLVNEHRLYLPSVGVSLVAAAVAAGLEARISPRKVQVAAGCLVFILAASTWKRNLVWSDEILFWSDAVDKAPGKARPHYNLGVILSRRGITDAAEQEFTTALTRDPGHASALYNRGVLRASRGDFEAAQADYRKALNIEPSLAEAHNSLGALHASRGELNEAIQAYRLAVSLAPNLADARNNLGAALAAAGSPDAAITEITAAIRIDAGNPAYHENLARTYAMKGLIGRAEEERRRAVQLREIR